MAHKQVCGLLSGSKSATHAEAAQQILADVGGGKLALHIFNELADLLVDVRATAAAFVVGALELADELVSVCGYFAMQISG